MCTYASFRVKRKSFYKKVNSRGFCWFPAAILVDQTVGPIWRLHTKLHKGAWNVSANNSKTVGHKDLRLGKIVYILLFYNISFSWLLPLLCVPCLLRDSVNELCQWYFFTSFFLLSRMSSSRNSKRSTDPRFSKSTILSLLDNKWPQARATGVKRTWRGLSNIAARLTSLNVEFHMCRTEFLF